MQSDRDRAAALERDFTTTAAALHLGSLLLAEDPELDRLCDESEDDDDEKTEAKEQKRAEKKDKGKHKEKEQQQPEQRYFVPVVGVVCDRVREDTWLLPSKPSHVGLTNGISASASASRDRSSSHQKLTRHALSPMIRSLFEKRLCQHPDYLHMTGLSQVHKRVP